MSDDARKLVLARRAKFVAAALAGMSIACGKENAPHPCLDVPPPEDASATTSTTPEAATVDAASTTPRPCLTISPKSPPPPSIPPSDRR